MPEPIARKKTVTLRDRFTINWAFVEQNAQRDRYLFPLTGLIEQSHARVEVSREGGPGEVGDKAGAC